ncbi:MAG: hypothetical protein GX455_08925 [Phycisphaerae bacterium]|nr:hypothetical protein [Phycisphaerae bacterium]
MRYLNRRWFEILAITGCVAFGLAILFPAAGMARGVAKGNVCMTNLHMLMRSWLAYAEDNNAQIVGSATYEANGWQYQGYPAWAPSGRILVKNFVAMPQDQNGAYRYQEVQDEIRGLKRGGLWPYLENEAAYHCPLDTRYLKPAVTMPMSLGGYRSYSIGCVYNGFAYGNGWATGEYYATVYKTNEIKSPSSKIVFVEEISGMGYNDNTWNLFLMGATFPNYWPGDPLSCLHNQGSPFGFADGHVESRLWRDPAVIKAFTDQVKNGSNPQYQFGPGEGADLCWFVRHYVPRTPQPGSGFYPLPW